MKAIRLIFIMAAVALVTMGLGSAAYAFHDGGVAYCEGCHTMHNSFGGQPMGQGAQFTGNIYYLQGTDQSSTCLNCHATTNVFTGLPNATTSFHIATYPTPAAGLAPSTYTPGGDFSWVQITTPYTVRGKALTNYGTRHGHNIVARDYEYSASTTFTLSPGGSYPSSTFYCSSCHDPHGRYRINSAFQIVSPSIGSQVPPIYSSGSYGALPTSTGNNGTGEAVGVYRLLGGNHYLPDSLGGAGALAFTSDPIIAIAPTTYNHTETDNGANQVIVAYGQNVSQWCGNCHGTIHANGQARLIHPTGSALDVMQINNYNAYVYSGNLTGTFATAYWSMVPVEREIPLAQLSTLATYASSPTQPANLATSQNGANSSSQVVCLSCHRAHASAWPAGTRWNNNGEFLVVAGQYPGIDAPTAEGQSGQYNLGYNQAQVQAAFYGRPATVFATYQRSLCNKCHAKD